MTNNCHLYTLYCNKWSTFFDCNNIFLFLIYTSVIFTFRDLNIGCNEDKKKKNSEEVLINDKLNNLN